MQFNLFLNSVQPRASFFFARQTPCLDVATSSTCRASPPPTNWCNFSTPIRFLCFNTRELPWCVQGHVVEIVSTARIGSFSLQKCLKALHTVMWAPELLLAHSLSPCAATWLQVGKALRSPRSEDVTVLAKHGGGLAVHHT